MECVRKLQSLVELAEEKMPSTEIVISQATNHKNDQNLNRKDNTVNSLMNELVREPVIGLTKWLRPKGLKVCSYAEKCAEFKNQTLKKLAGTQRCYAQWNTPGLCNISK